MDEVRDFLKLDEPDQPEAWEARAGCASADPDAFFPEKGGSVREAKRVCARCDVTADCLNYALDNDERYGVWGGRTERERRKILRADRAADRSAVAA